MERGSRMKVGRVTRLRSAPGRSWLIMCDSTAGSLLSVITCSACCIGHHRAYCITYHFPGRRRRQFRHRRSCLHLACRCRQIAGCLSLSWTDALASCFNVASFRSTEFGGTKPTIDRMPPMAVSEHHFVPILEVLAAADLRSCADRAGV